MDPFLKLPSEIRTYIIVHVESYSAIMKLIRASPAMLWQYTTERYNIAVNILRPILALDDGTILQDALMVVRSHNNDVRFDTKDAILRLLALDHPDPVAQKDRDMTMKLYRVISFVICWIEDFVSKATDPFPSRAYMVLPEMATGWRGMRYQDEIVDIKPVFFSQLLSSERCLLLRGFLRGEVYCRIDAVVSPNMRSILFRKAPFNRLILDAPRKDLDAISCCMEYLFVLYTLLFKDAAWVRTTQSGKTADFKVHKQTSLPSLLPSRPSLDATNTNGPEQEPSLCFPENVCVCHRLSNFDLFFPYESPGFGFSKLSSSLISANRTGEKPQSEAYQYSRTNGAGCIGSMLLFLRALTMNRNGNEPTTLKICIGDGNNANMPVPIYGTIPANDLLRLIRLQRAFGMFENERLYPGGKCIIPSPEDLQRLADDTWRSFGFQKDAYSCPWMEYSLHFY